jgi:hypothetical protein
MEEEMPLTIIDGPTIAAGESLSDGIDCRAGPLIRITMPAAWTGAKLSFQVSSDGSFYNDVVDPKGNEYIIRCVPGTAVRVPSEWNPMIQFLKVRSGSRQRPVVQEMQRHFAVAIETS